MQTNTIRYLLRPEASFLCPNRSRIAGISYSGLAALLIALFAAGSSHATTVISPWTPIFKGIEHAVGTNVPDGTGFPTLQVVHTLRVDLTDPDVRLFPSPRYTNFVANYTEASGYTATNFLRLNGLQVAINANSFFLPGGGQPGYTVPEGSPFDISGLFISQGQVVSTQDSANDSSTLLFSANNTATFIPTNWPPVPTLGTYTAVSGLYPVLVNGVNVGSNYNIFTDPHGLEPRTAFGLSQDRRYLFILAIDGRQPGYSDGAYDWETAGWLQIVGASDGANMDGGGSTCLVIMDTTGKPLPLNHESASLAVGRERTVGAQFGIFAKPVPGFFNDVRVLQDDTAATITWTTVEPTTTQLKYGLTTDLALSTVSDATPATNHATLLTGLSSATGYYFAALGSTETSNHVSPMYFFITTNYVITQSLFDLTNAWNYTFANQDASNWTARIYDESGWSGPGPGVLWADYRGPNPNIPADLNTGMPLNPGTGYPYTTYYFRTHFTFTNNPAGAAIQVSGYIDDGAVFYLNGREIYRLRMPLAPTKIYNATFATGYPCTGDATCPDTFSVSGGIISTNLFAGDNVLAVEVHNRSAASADITFGLAAALTLPYTPHPTLRIENSNSAVTLKWSEGGYTLQQANTPAGDWANVPGPVFISPFTTNNPEGNQFYRLAK